MNVPHEFHDFCSRFHQDVFLVNPSMQDAIEAALKQFDGRQRKVLETFLTGLLEKDLSDAELDNLWNSSGADFYLRGAREFFREVVNRLENSVASSFPGS